MNGRTKRIMALLPKNCNKTIRQCEEPNQTTSFDNTEMNTDDKESGQKASSIRTEEKYNEKVEKWLRCNDENIAFCEKSEQELLSEHPSLPSGSTTKNINDKEVESLDNIQKKNTLRRIRRGDVRK